MDEKEIELDASGKPTKAWLEYMYTEKHLSHKSIAKLTGINSSNLYYLMQEMGIQFRQQTPRIEKEVLERMYVTENLSSEEIGERLGIATSRVRYLLQTVYGIAAKHPKPRKTIRPTREWLMQKHFVEGVSWKDIREMLGYGDGTFHELLKEYDIPRKQYMVIQETVSKDDLYQWHVVEGQTAVSIAAQLGCSHTVVSRLIKNYGLDPQRPLVNSRRMPPMSKEELEHLYLDEQLTWRAIGEKYGTSGSTAKRWLNDHGIPRRSSRPERYQKNRTRTRLPLPQTRLGRNFTNEDREKIKVRDGYRCQMPECGCTDKWKLEVHHIIPVEHDGTNDLENGITLCRPCHISIKHKELQYVTLFQYLVKTTLSGVKTHYIGETPENQDNPDGSLVQEVYSPEEYDQTR